MGGPDLGGSEDADHEARYGGRRVEDTILVSSREAS
jgi:hypothetical protein